MDDPAMQEPTDKAPLPAPKQVSDAWLWLMLPMALAMGVAVIWRSDGPQALRTSSARFFLTLLAAVTAAIVAGMQVFYRHVKVDKRSDAFMALVFTFISLLMLAVVISFLRSPDFTWKDIAGGLFLLIMIASFAIEGYGNWFDWKWSAPFEFLGELLFTILICAVLLVPSRDPEFIADHPILFAPFNEGARFVIPFLWLGIGVFFFIGGLREKDRTILSNPIIIVAWPFLLILKDFWFLAAFAVILGVIYGISYVGHLLGHSRLITSITVAILVGILALAVIRNGPKSGAEPGQTEI